MIATGAHRRYCDAWLTGNGKISRGDEVSKNRCNSYWHHASTAILYIRMCRPPLSLDMRVTSAVCHVSRREAEQVKTDHRGGRFSASLSRRSFSISDPRSTRFSSIVYWKLYVGEVFMSYRNRMINRCKNKDTYVYHIRFARIRIY